jgi:hypothetical protein
MVLVVLDHDERVADVAQALQRRDHLHVVLRMQADTGLVEHVEHTHQPGSDLRGQSDALGLAAGQRAGAAVEIQIVEPDPEKQRQPGPDFLEDVASGVGAAPRRLDGAEKGVELIEVHLADVVERAAGDGEQLPRPSQPRALAVRADLLDHHLVEPRFHPRVRLAALAVMAVVALDAPGDAVEADLTAFPVVAPDSCVGRRLQDDLARLDAVQDRGPGRLGQLIPWGIEREAQRHREAEHHPAVPGIGVVLERLANEAAAENAALRIRNQQLRVGDLVNPEAAAGPAGALRVVEDEEIRADVAIDEMMSGTAQAAVEALGVRL